VAGRPQPVAVGVLEDGSGNVLLQRRRRGQVCAGQWEFPGGKIRPGEDPRAAVARELEEELGIRAAGISPWLRRFHRYSHAECDLHFLRALRWEGAPAGMEGQELAWVPKRSAPPEPLLAGSRDPWKWLALPATCMITDIGTAGLERTLERWERIQDAGPAMLRLRDKGLPDGAREAALSEIARRRREGSLVVCGDERAARDGGACGVHLDSAALGAASRRPDAEWVGASCHDERGLMRAADLGIDYVTLSPVLPTRTHPRAQPLGWERFAELAGGCGLPVYALGGLGPEDIDRARSCGAHGIAGIRAFVGD